MPQPFILLRRAQQPYEQVRHHFRWVVQQSLPANYFFAYFSLVREPYFLNGYLVVLSIISILFGSCSCKELSRLPDNVRQYPTILRLCIVYISLMLKHLDSWAQFPCFWVNRISGLKTMGVFGSESKILSPLYLTLPEFPWQGLVPIYISWAHLTQNHLSTDSNRWNKTYRVKNTVDIHLRVDVILFIGKVHTKQHILGTMIDQSCAVISWSPHHWSVLLCFYHDP